MLIFLGIFKRKICIQIKIENISIRQQRRYCEIRLEHQVIGYIIVLLQKSTSGETSFSDIAKYSIEQLTDKDNPPEGIDMQHKEV